MVSERREPITTDSGMKIMPDYTYGDAPTTEIVVVPAEKRESPARDEWLKKVNKNRIGTDSGYAVLASSRSLRLEHFEIYVANPTLQLKGFT